MENNSSGTSPFLSRAASPQKQQPPRDDSVAAPTPSQPDSSTKTTLAVGQLAPPSAIPDVAPRSEETSNSTLDGALEGTDALLSRQSDASPAREAILDGSQHDSLRRSGHGHGDADLFLAGSWRGSLPKDASIGLGNHSLMQYVGRPPSVRTSDIGDAQVFSLKEAERLWVLSPTFVCLARLPTRDLASATSLHQLIRMRPAPTNRMIKAIGLDNMDDEEEEDEGEAAAVDGNSNKSDRLDGHGVEGGQPGVLKGRKASRASSSPADAKAYRDIPLPSSDSSSSSSSEGEGDEGLRSSTSDDNDEGQATSETARREGALTHANVSAFATKVGSHDRDSASESGNRHGEKGGRGREVSLGERPWQALNPGNTEAEGVASTHHHAFVMASQKQRTPHRRSDTY